MIALTAPGSHRAGEQWPVYLGELNPSRTAIIDSACFVARRSLRDCQVGTIQAGPIADGNRAWWANDSRHVFVNSGGRLGAFAIDRVAKTVRLVDEPREHRFLKSWTLEIVGPSPSTSREAEWARIRAAEDWFAAVRDPVLRRSPVSLMRVTLGPEGMTASGTLRGTIILAAIRPTDGLDVEDSGHSVAVFQGEERPLLLRDEQGDEWLVGMGEALRKPRGARGEKRRWESGPQAGLYGKRPILDSATGRVLGVHTERDIVWIRPDSELQTLRSRILAALPPDGTLHQIVFARTAGTAVVIIFGLSMAGHIVLDKERSTGDWRIGTADCRRTERSSSPGVIPTRERLVTTYDAGELGWPIMALIERHVGNRRLAVYLHGGPDRTVLYRDVRRPPVPVDRYDWVSYDPSGTIGVDASVAQRIADFGGEALERDANLIVADVMRLSASYDEIVMYASSFGGALVPAVAKGLGDRLKRAYLAAPLAAHHHPLSNVRELAHARKKNFTESFSVLFHDLHFGNRRADGKTPFDRWLKEQYRGFVFDERFVIVQGRTDDLSRPGDIPNPGRAEISLVDGGHVDAHSHQGVICWLADECD